MKPKHIIILSVFLLVTMAGCRKDANRIEKAKIFFDKGVELRDLKHTEAAADAFNEALLLVNQCKTLNQESQHLKAQIEDNLGAVYYIHGVFEEAMPLHIEAIGWARQTDDTTLLLTALRDGGRTAACLGQYGQASDYYNEALRLSWMLNDSVFANDILVEMARDVFLPSEDYDRVVSASLGALSATQRPDICHLNLGLAYYYTEQDSLAFVHLEEAAQSTQAGIRMSAYKCLSNLYQFTGNLSRALECHELFNENMIQADQAHRSEKIQQIKGEYDLKMQKSSMEVKQKTKTLWLCLILGFLVAALVVTLLILRQKTLSERLQLAISRNQLEEKLKQNRVYLTALALTKEVTSSTIDFDLKDEEWDEFVSLIDAIYDNFTRRLIAKYPSLTKSDVQLCCLIKQGFSSQVISILMNLQMNSFARRKTRIKQEKMNAVDDGRSFEEILNSL